MENTWDRCFLKEKNENQQLGTWNTGVGQFWDLNKYSIRMILEGGAVSHLRSKKSVTKMCPF